MRHTFVILTLLFLVSLPLSLPAAVQNSQDTPQQPVYRPTGKEATLIGSILGNGKVPLAPKYDMTNDQACVALNRPFARVNDLVVTNQGLQSAVVYVKSGGPLNAYRFEVPASEVTLEHKNCYFSPRVLGIRAGQKLSVVNRDPTFHNIHPTPRVNQEWNVSMAMGSPPFVKTFTRPEQFIPVKCNQHPWERAIVGVFAHPFFAVSDQLGNYEIRGLPEGTYKLVVWHEKLGQQEMDLTVVAGESRRLDFTFDVPADVHSPKGSSSQIGGSSQVP